MTTNGSDPAYPVEVADRRSGLTKREEFAKAALSGLATKPTADSSNVRYLGRRAAELADALIAALNAEEKEASDGS